MSLEYPQQERAIDSYASYNSNVVNRLTRMITRGKNCLHGTHAIDVYLNPATPLTEVIVSEGEAFKDDVLIAITAEHTVDVSHSDYYINHMNPWNEAGYYYLCLEYTYTKSNPAPVSKIRLLKPTQLGFYDENSSAFLLLKIIKVELNSTTGLFEIISLHDVHPDDSSIKRIYAQLYAGVEDELPEFETARDEGRIIYCRNQDELFFGTSSAWESFSAIRANIDTTDCTAGQMAYIGQDGKVHPAIALGPETLADCGVLQIGEGYNGDGKVRLYGILRGVPIEAGRTIQYGENVYLSASVAGSITDLVNPSNPQFLGSCITQGDSDTTCDIWFLPTGHGNGGGGNAWQDLYQDLLDGSIFTDISVESFTNFQKIDQPLTTAQIYTSDFSLVGDSGDVFQSLSLQSADYTGPKIEVCQVSMTMDSTSNMQIYVSNKGGEDDSWEDVELNRLHYFSTYKLTTVNNTGAMNVGDNIHSITSNKVATIVGISGQCILVTGDTRVGVDYMIGEHLENLDAIGECVITEVENRQLETAYYDLRVKIVFNSPSKIDDFGVLYSRDEDIFNEDINIVNLISTLFLDMYEYPEIVDDGAPRFPISVQEQFRNLYDYVDSSDSTAALAMEYIDNDVDTLYNDIYITPVRENDGYPNLVTPLEQQIASLDLLLTNLTNSTTLNNSELNNDVDTLFNDVYSSPSRDNDGLPNLTMNLEDRIVRREGSSINISSVAETISVIDKTTAVFLTSTSTYSIIYITDGVAGQEITFVFLASNTTMNSGTTIRLSGGQSFTGSINDTITLIYTGTIWVERCRSLNS